MPGVVHGCYYARILGWIFAGLLVEELAQPGGATQEECEGHRSHHAELQAALVFPAAPAIPYSVQRNLEKTSLGALPFRLGFGALLYYSYNRDPQNPIKNIY